MKLEYLDDANTSGGLVRLFDFGIEEASELQVAIGNLADGKIAEIDFTKIAYVELINGCRLRLVENSWDQGLMLIDKPATFRCALTLETWDNIAGLIQPFTETQIDGHGFQWLDTADIPLLLSQSGQW